MIANDRQGPGGAPAVEQRATVRLKYYWLSLRRNEKGPFFAGFSPDRNPIPWEQCCIASTREDGSLAFDHVGATYASVFALAPLDAQPGRAPGPRFVSIFGDMREALEGLEPVERDGYYGEAGEGVLFRSIWLPFVNLAGTPAYVLGAFAYGRRPRPAAASPLPSQVSEDLTPVRGQRR
jgi:hypothetical protein